MENSNSLTAYARGVLLAFVSYTGLRLATVIGSIIGLWVTSDKPLGGLLLPTRAQNRATTPTTPRRHTSARDPALTKSPARSWLEEESEFAWSWKERSRSRIQDAYELCIVRPRRRHLDGGFEDTQPFSPMSPSSEKVPGLAEKSTNRQLDQVDSRPEDRSRHVNRSPEEPDILAAPASRALAESVPDVFYTPAASSSGRSSIRYPHQASHEDKLAAVVSFTGRQAIHNTSSRLNGRDEGITNSSGWPGSQLSGSLSSFSTRSRNLSLASLGQSLESAVAHAGSMVRRARSGSLLHSVRHDHGKLAVTETENKRKLCS